MQGGEPPLAFVTAKIDSVPNFGQRSAPLHRPVSPNTHPFPRSSHDPFPAGSVSALVVYDASKRGYCYATVQNDQLVSTGVLAGSRTRHPQRSQFASAATAGAEAANQSGLSSEARRKQAQAMHQRLHAHKHDVVANNGAVFRSAPLATNSTFGQLSGPVKGLTVMIQFPDQVGTMTTTIARKAQPVISV